MAFDIKIPTINYNVAGNGSSLTIVGVRAYNLENPYFRKSEERFKLFIGCQNGVFTNLCISPYVLKRL